MKDIPSHPPFVLSLPMRNWNAALMLTLTKLLQGSQPTYEELKQRVFGLAHLRAGRVLSLPMRNWNAGTEGQTPLRCPVLSLPMRNWNENWQAIATFLERGSQPTYEELKPRQWRVFLHEISGSQPTYEELKHLGFPLSRPALQVLSLPMRNWNGPVASARQYWYGVLSLPMRNWNPWAVHNSPAPFLPVLSLPMRNWNPPCPWPRRRASAGSQPTYEELKLKHFSLKSERINRSQPTYEELKPYGRVSCDD